MTSINVQEGSDVAKDDIILGLSGDDLTESIQSASESLRSAEISMQNLQDTMNNYTITAPISGTIIEKDAKVGDAVKTGDTLCIVYDLSYLEMSINVDELQISSISVGQQVQITADAVPDKTYVGTVDPRFDEGCLQRPAPRPTPSASASTTPTACAPA